MLSTSGKSNHMIDSQLFRLSTAIGAAMMVLIKDVTPLSFSQKFFDRCIAILQSTSLMDMQAMC